MKFQIFPGVVDTLLLSGHTDTHRTNCSTWTTKLIGNAQNV